MSPSYTFAVYKPVQTDHDIPELPGMGRILRIQPNPNFWDPNRPNPLKALPDSTYADSLPTSEIHVQTIFMFTLYVEIGHGHAYLWLRLVLGMGLGLGLELGEGYRFMVK